MSGRRVGPDSLDLQAGDTARIPTTVTAADRARIAERDQTARLNLSGRIRRRHLADPDPEGPPARAELRELLDILGLLPKPPKRRRPSTAVVSS